MLELKRRKFEDIEWLFSAFELALSHILAKAEIGGKPDRKEFIEELGIEVRYGKI